MSKCNLYADKISTVNDSTERFSRMDRAAAINLQGLRSTLTATVTYHCSLGRLGLGLIVGTDRQIKR
jgi:hypothetical protein